MVSMTLDHQLYIIYTNGSFLSITKFLHFCKCSHTVESKHPYRVCAINCIFCSWEKVSCQTPKYIGSNSKRNDPHQHISVQIFISKSLPTSPLFSPQVAASPPFLLPLYAGEGHEGPAPQVSGYRTAQFSHLYSLRSQRICVSLACNDRLPLTTMGLGPV